MFSRSYQDYLGKTYQPEQLREQARACFHDSQSEEHWAKGKMYLLIAARMGDRGAAWLLTLYYREGCYGFEQDHLRSEYWRKHTDKCLKQDADVSYEDKALKEQAVFRYQRWQSYWKGNQELFG